MAETSPSSRLDRAVDLRPAGPGWDWDVPDGWQQGRGAYGGLVLAGMLRAVEAAGADAGADPGRRLRSVSAQILAPLPVGPARVEVEALKLGSAVSTYSVSLRAGGAADVIARAVAVLGGARHLQPPPGEWAERSPVPLPSATDWRDVPVLSVGPPIAPVFLQHVEMRLVAGIPMTGAAAGDAAEVLAWVRFLRDDSGPAPAYDEVGLVALVDVPWPVALVRLEAPRPMATLTFEAAVTADPRSLDPEQPLLFRSRNVAGRDGYLVEVRELWSPDGRLAVHNVQTLVLIR